jgi:hypothetical protein
MQQLKLPFVIEHEATLAAQAWHNHEQECRALEAEAAQRETTPRFRHVSKFNALMGH